jgi:hypothetical protein
MARAAKVRLCFTCLDSLGCYDGFADPWKIVDAIGMVVLPSTTATNLILPAPSVILQPYSSQHGEAVSLAYM